MNKENNLRNYSLAQQEYQTKSEEELQAQEVDRKARKDIYTNLFRLADRGKSGSNEMLFWQFILQFYAYCLEKKGDNSFIDASDSETLDLVEEFAHAAGCDDFKLKFNETIVEYDDFVPAEKVGSPQKLKVTPEDVKSVLEDAIRSKKKHRR